MQAVLHCWAKSADDACIERWKLIMAHSEKAVPAHPGAFKSKPSQTGEDEQRPPYDPVIMTDDHIKVNWAANLVLSVNDPEALAEIATCAPLEKVRLFATRKLVDQRALFGIARTDPALFVREAAGKRITDPALVKRIAFETDEVSVVKEAISKLESQDDLAEIAACAQNAAVREWAAQFVKDPDLLADIALVDTPTEN